MGQISSVKMIPKPSTSTLLLFAAVWALPSEIRKVRRGDMTQFAAKAEGALPSLCKGAKWTRRDFSSMAKRQMANDSQRFSLANHTNSNANLGLFWEALLPERCSAVSTK